MGDIKWINVLTGVLIALVLLQIIAGILTPFFPEAAKVNISEGIFLIIIAATVWIALFIVYRYTKGGMEAGTLLIYFLVLAIFVAIIIFAPKIAPNLFHNHIFSFRSFVGLG